MVRWNYRPYSRQSVLLRHGRYPKRLTPIGRGDFYQRYFVVDVCCHNYGNMHCGTSVCQPGSHFPAGSGLSDVSDDGSKFAFHVVGQFIPPARTCF
jgi:hypothetical protein